MEKNQRAFQHFVAFFEFNTFMKEQEEVNALKFVKVFVIKKTEIEFLLFCFNIGFIV